MNIRLGIMSLVAVTSQHMESCVIEHEENLLNLQGRDLIERIEPVPTLLLFLKPGIG